MPTLEEEIAILRSYFEGYEAALNYDEKQRLASQMFTYLSNSEHVLSSRALFIVFWICALDIVSLAELLLQNKPDMFRNGWFQVKSKEMIDLLLKYGADINSTNASGLTLLMRIIETSDYDSKLEIVMHLISKGANVNNIDEFKNTALHYAALTNNKNIVRALMDAGADPTIENSDGLTARNIAKFNNHNGVASEFEAVENNVFSNMRLNGYNGPVLPKEPLESVPFNTYKFEKQEDLLIVTIPKGTLLYNASSVPSTLSEANLLKTCGGILPMTTNVRIEGDEMIITSCIDQFSGKFFYSSPVGGPALGDGYFNTCNVFETKRNMRFAVLMSPSHLHRLVGEHPDKMPCNQMDTKYCNCASKEGDTDAQSDVGATTTSTATATASEEVWLHPSFNHYGGGSAQRGGKRICSYAHNYDVCLSPSLLHRLRLDGHIAIAVEDSYKKLMRSFEESFLFKSHYDKEYKKLTRILFNGGRSIDDRTAYATKTVSGLPELVIQIFGTDWYEEGYSKEFEHRIPLPVGHTLKSRLNLLAYYLIQHNSDTVPHIGVQTPLRLLGISTASKGYKDFIRGTSTTLGFPTRNPTDAFYLNFLKAYFDGKLRFYFDVRTGFLVREDAPISVIMPDGTERAFLELCMMGGEGASGRTALEKTAAARRVGTGPWDAGDCLIPAVRQTGGRRSRRAVVNGTRNQKLNMLMEPLGVPSKSAKMQKPSILTKYSIQKVTRRRPRSNMSTTAKHELTRDGLEMIDILMAAVHRNNQEITNLSVHTKL